MLKKNHYEIHVRGSLGDGWEAWFSGITIQKKTDSPGASGVTVISGSMDHAALHGILDRIRDLGLKLLKVQMTEPEKK